MNNVTLIGRLARDPELRFIPSGQPVTNFTVAVDRRMSKEKKAEAQAKGQPTADFIRVITWGKTAEAAAQNLQKGNRVAVKGSIQTSSYKTNTGETRYSTEVVTESIEYIDSKLTQNQQHQEPMNGGGSEDYRNDFMSIEDDEDIPF